MYVYYSKKKIFPWRHACYITPRDYADNDFSLLVVGRVLAERMTYFMKITIGVFKDVNLRVFTLRSVIYKFA
jgi:hypothetical protein